MDILNGEYVFEALLAHNYFPMVKEHRDDIPPLFTTTSLTAKVGKMLINCSNGMSASDKKSRASIGFDQIEYRTTRFNNVPRLMHIPHPLPFSRLCGVLRDNWHHLDYVCNNEHSRIKPERHKDGRIYVIGDSEYNAPGRIIIMGKDRFPEDINRHLTLSLGAHYYVEADVSSCFPSLYSHAIPWALVGHKQAKSDRELTKWYNKIDICQRNLKRNETSGVPVGPATSNIINEIILARVDKSLVEGEYRFVRFIDDYKCYCKTKEQADAFIRDLERALSRYLLTLNARKVVIKTLPIAHKETWLIKLSHGLPRGDEVSQREIVDAIDMAVVLQRHNEDGSVIKYAMRTLANKINEQSAQLYCQYALQLAFHYPVVLPILCKVVKQYNVELDTEQLGLLLLRQVVHRRSDMICWTLYLMALCDAKVAKEAAQSIIELQDCMAMSALAVINQHGHLVKEYVKSLDCQTPYEMDKHWLLIYELILRKEKIGSHFESYIKASGLSCLVEESVSFFKPVLRG